MKKTIFIILFVLVVLIGCGSILYSIGIGAVSSKSEEVTVEVPNGRTVYDILDILDESGLIKNSLCAKAYIKFNRIDSLKSNVYVLNKNMKLSQITDIISSGDKNYIVKADITVIEGATVPEIAEEIAKKTGLSKSNILKKWSDKTYLKKLINDYWFMDDVILGKDMIYPLEGYLYPETYFVNEKNPDIESITEKMLDMTGNRLSGIKDSIKGLRLTAHEFLTLASIVEGETFRKEDRAKIAGVYWNRLKFDMKLQSDITTLYALGKKHIDVSLDETHVDSPYNTYMVKGLPAGPVCNPRLEVMEAVINCEKHGYFYYFSLKDGSVIYSKTYEEHKKTVQKNKWY